MTEILYFTVNIEIYRLPKILYLYSLHMEVNKKALIYVQSLFQNKVINFINFFDRQITATLINEGIKTRPAKSNGLWCCILLPAVLIIYTLQENVSPLYKLAAFCSVGLMVYCFLLIIFMSISCLVLKEIMFGGCVASGLVATLTLYTFSGHDILVCLLIAIPNVYLFNILLRLAIMQCPKTFTVGEAMVVVQSIVLFTSMSVTKLALKLHDKVDSEMEFITKIVYAILSTVGLIVTALYLVSDKHRNISVLGSIFFGAAIYGLVVLHLTLGGACIPRIFHYIFGHKNRARLFTFWLAMSIVSGFVIMIRTKLAVKADTVTRKTFHILASLVFMSGILTDVHLMTFAAGFGLGLLVLLEALRISKIEPISGALHDAFLIYSDEKDVGTFAMTPVYLYAGLAAPLLLAHGSRLELLSGVLAIGVGDTAASWFGSRYGRLEWPDSSKTFEGTVFNVLSQIATVNALTIFDLLPDSNSLVRTAVAATVTAVVEANTDQVDNLVLPLVNILAYQTTWFLR